MEGVKKEIKLVRHDLAKVHGENDVDSNDVILENIDECTEILRDSEVWPMDREGCIRQFELPKDSIIKVYYEGHLVPWSLIQKCPSLEIKVFRPNQNGKLHRPIQCIFIM